MNELTELKIAVAELKAARVQAVVDAMDRLNRTERMEVIGSFCKHCGSDDNACQCWNDE